MKLISCPICNDIVALTRLKKSCQCGSVYGKYVDHIKAKVSPGAILLAADTNKITFIENHLYKEITLEHGVIPHDGCDIIFERFEE